MASTTIYFKDGEALTIDGVNADAVKFGDDRYLTIFDARNNIYIVYGDNVKYIKITVHESESE